jgi:hypothetical protein
MREKGGTDLHQIEEELHNLGHLEGLDVFGQQTEQRDTHHKNGVKSLRRKRYN